VVNRSQVTKKKKENFNPWAYPAASSAQNQGTDKTKRFVPVKAISSALRVLHSRSSSWHKILVAHFKPCYKKSYKP
jgi:hypothetical protein